MRDIGRLPRRVVGRQALERRVRALLIAVHRFGRSRARTVADLRWAAVAIEALTTVLGAYESVRAESSETTHRPAPAAETRQAGAR